MKERYRVLLIVFVALFLHAGAFAIPVTDRYTTRQISVSDGLNHVFVDDLLIDSNGFMWIATAGGGLARYDGYDFITFGVEKGKRMLSGTFIIKLTEDNHKRLWIAAREGLDIIDINTTYPTLPNDRTGILGNLMGKRTFYVATDSFGRIWINNIDGIACVKIDPETGDVTDISYLGGVYHEPNLIAIKDVCHDGSPWIMAGGSVYRLQSAPDHTIKMEPVSERLSFGETDLTASDFLSKDSDIWISTNRGLLRYDSINDHVRWYRHSSGESGSLSNNYTTALSLTDKGSVLVGSLSGVDEYNAITDDFRQWTHNTKDDLKFVNCLLSDGKRIWIGTERRGIMLLSPHKPGIRIYTHNDNNPGSIAPSFIQAVYQDSHGEWWLGTSEYGLNKADAGFSSFHDFIPFNTKMNYPSVTSICEDKDGLIWIGTWGRGIVAFNPASNKIIKHLEAPDIIGKDIRLVTLLLYDHINDLIWIGTNQGLLTYDIKSDSVKEPFQDAYTKASWMLGGVIEADTTLWLAGKYGLYKIDLRSRDEDGSFSLKHYFNRLDDPESNTLERLGAICLTKTGKLWIGSNGNGVYLREKGKGGEDTSKNISNNELSGKSILGIHEDANGRLWVITAKGIYCRLPNGSFITYNNSDLFPTLMFCENSSSVGKNGNIVLGTTEGLMTINPSVAGEPSNSVSKVKLTDIIIDGNPVATPETNSLTVHESAKSIEIGFSALDYEKKNNSGGRYLYRLKGFENNWDTLTSGRHHAKYTNLPPGDYTFEVMYSGAGSTTDEAAITSVHLKVKPYFYRHWWFQLMVIIAVIMIVYGLYRWRIRTLSSQKRILQKNVEERTREISSQKSLLETQNQQLREANEEMSVQKARLSEMVDTVQNLTSERINFFTAITHEFRTPVTLISGPIKRALKLTTDPNIIEQLSFAEQNSRYLLSLINQIMDFRKLESGRMRFSFARNNLVKFLDNLIDSFLPSSLELGIDIRLLVHLPVQEVCYADDALHKVMVNLLSNALKYTPRGGTVTVYAATLGTAVNNERLYICVSDNGEGIADNDTDRLFDRYYQGSTPPLNPISGTTGSGIGLHLCKSIVEACGGIISVKNNPGAGCSFRILLPVNEAPGSTERNITDPAEDPGPQAHQLPGHDVTAMEAHNSILTIMIVEDNLSMRKYIRSILEAKYAIVEAPDGKEALNILANNTVDFIITDLMMPVMDGHELSQRIKSDIKTSHIPIIMLTAKSSQQTQLRSYRIGVDEYISKPFDEELLLARIENILKNKKRYQTNFVKDLDVKSFNLDEDSLDKQFLEHMMEVVEKNYRDSEFEVSDFAREMAMGRNVLNQKMQSLVGQTAWQFVKTYRVIMAYELIVRNRERKTLSISEIAYDTGFSDPKYFSKSFSRHFGLSPRNLMNGEEDSPDAPASD